MKYSKVHDSERFTLRVLKRTDASHTYLSWLTNPDSSQFIASARSTWTIDRLREYISEIEQKPRALFFGIFLRESGRHIGNIKFENIGEPTGCAELGVLIGDTNWRGKGVFGEVFKTLQQVLSENFGIKKIYLGVESENHAAIRSYLKSGFINSSDKYFLSKNSRFNGVEMFAIIKSC
jgi:ribosomal-protein-alanine N-acetyltransferase